MAMVEANLMNQKVNNEVQLIIIQLLEAQKQGILEDCMTKYQGKEEIATNIVNNIKAAHPGFYKFKFRSNDLFPKSTLSNIKEIAMRTGVVELDAASNQFDIAKDCSHYNMLQFLQEVFVQ